MFVRFQKRKYHEPIDYKVRRKLDNILGAVLCAFIDGNEQGLVDSSCMV